MSSKSKIVLSIFVAACTCIQQSLAQKLLLGESVALKDKQTGVYYASISNDEKDKRHFSLPISLEIEPSIAVDSFVVDGVKYANGDVVKVEANVSKHKLEYAEKNEQKELSFVLTSLPLITINRQSDTSFALDTPVLTRFAIYDPYCRTDSASSFSSYANVFLRGATASMMEKKSYKVKLVDEDFTEENDANLFGIRANDSWILDAAAIDYSRIRNRVCTDVWNEMSTLRDEDMMRNGTQGLYCELMLDGTYQGVYCFTDKISRKLLGLKKVDDEGDDAEVRGVLYKCKGNDYGPSKLKKEERPWDRYNTDMWYDWSLKYPDDIYDERSWQPLYNLIDHTDQLSANPDSVRMLTDCFYYDNMVEYAVFCMSMQLLDNVMHNTYLSVKNRNKSMKVWITPWDMDGSFGRDGAAYVYDVQAKSFQVFGETHPFRYYFDNQVQPFYDDFVRLMKSLHEAGKPLSSDFVSQRIDYYTEILEQSGAWKRERERWNGMNNFWSNTPINLSDSLAEETTFMKNWYKQNEVYFSVICDIPKVDNMGNNGRLTKTDIYMINGIKVNVPWSELSHGVYIVNGKKIVK